MLAYHELLYIKEIHSDYDLLYISYEDKEFVFRCLTREEYKQIVSIIVDDFEFEDAVCQCCLIYPEEYDFSSSYLAGLSQKITPIIVEISNLNNPKALIDMYNMEKQFIANFDEQCINLIKAAFQEFSYDEINSWPWKKIIKYSARAEKIMSFRGYEIQMVNNYEEFEQEVAEKTESITEYEIGNALREKGVDPMDYFSYEFESYTDSIDYPIIGTHNWKDEEMMSAIRKQMENKNGKRKSKEIQFIQAKI